MVDEQPESGGRPRLEEAHPPQAGAAHRLGEADEEGHRAGRLVGLRRLAQRLPELADVRAEHRQAPRPRRRRGRGPRRPGRTPRAGVRRRAGRCGTARPASAAAGTGGPVRPPTRRRSRGSPRRPPSRRPSRQGACRRGGRCGRSGCGTGRPACRRRRHPWGQAACCSLVGLGWAEPPRPGLVRVCVGVGVADGGAAVVAAVVVPVVRPRAVAAVVLGTAGARPAPRWRSPAGWGPHEGGRRGRARGGGAGGARVAVRAPAHRPGEARKPARHGRPQAP